MADVDRCLPYGDMRRLLLHHKGPSARKHRIEWRHGPTGASYEEFRELLRWMKSTQFLETQTGLLLTPILEAVGASSTSPDLASAGLPLGGIQEASAPGAADGASAAAAESGSKGASAVESGSQGASAAESGSKGASAAESGSQGASAEHAQQGEGKARAADKDLKASERDIKDAPDEDSHPALLGSDVGINARLVLAPLAADGVTTAAVTSAAETETPVDTATAAATVAAAPPGAAALATPAAAQALAPTPATAKATASKPAPASAPAPAPAPAPATASEPVPTSAPAPVPAPATASEPEALEATVAPGQEPADLARHPELHPAATSAPAGTAADGGHQGPIGHTGSQAHDAAAVREVETSQESLGEQPGTTTGEGTEAKTLEPVNQQAGSEQQHGSLLVGPEIGVTRPVLVESKGPEVAVTRPPLAEAKGPEITTTSPSLVESKGPEIPAGFTSSITSVRPEVTQRVDFHAPLPGAAAVDGALPSLWGSRASDSVAEGAHHHPLVGMVAVLDDCSAAITKVRFARHRPEIFAYAAGDGTFRICHVGRCKAPPSKDAGPWGSPMKKSRTGEEAGAAKASSSPAKRPGASGGPAQRKSPAAGGSPVNPGVVKPSSPSTSSPALTKAASVPGRGSGAGKAPGQAAKSPAVGKAGSLPAPSSAKTGGSPPAQGTGPGKAPATGSARGPAGKGKEKGSASPVSSAAAKGAGGPRLGGGAAGGPAGSTTTKSLAKPANASSSSTKTPTTATSASSSSTTKSTANSTNASSSTTKSPAKPANPPTSSGSRRASAGSKSEITPACDAAPPAGQEARKGHSADTSMAEARAAAQSERRAAGGESSQGAFDAQGARNTDCSTPAAPAAAGTLHDSGSDAAVSAANSSAENQVPSIPRVMHELHGHTKGVTDFDWSADDEYLCSSSLDKSLRVWEVATGKCLRIIYTELHQLCVRFHPRNSNFLVAANAKPEVTVVNFSTGRVVSRHSLAHRVSAIEAAQPDVFFAGDAEGCIHSFTVDERSGAMVHHHSNRMGVAHPAPTTSLHFRPTSALANTPVLLSCCQDGSVRFYSVALELQGYLFLKCSLQRSSRGPNLTANFAPCLATPAPAEAATGEFIVTGNADHHICFFDFFQPRRLFVGKALGHRGFVMDVSFNTTGEWLASGDATGVVILWKPVSMLP